MSHVDAVGAAFDSQRARPSGEVVAWFERDSRRVPSESQV